MMVHMWVTVIVSWTMVQEKKSQGRFAAMRPASMLVGNSETGAKEKEEKKTLR